MTISSYKMHISVLPPLLFVSLHGVPGECPHAEYVTCRDITPQDARNKNIYFYWGKWQKCTVTWISNFNLIIGLEIVTW